VFYFKRLYQYETNLFADKKEHSKNEVSLKKWIVKWLILEIN